MRLYCTFCGKSVSTEVPDQTIVRAVFACPECIEKGALQTDACVVGMHDPVIVHRTGGPSAKVKNFCGKCGRKIQNINGVWMLDQEREECPEH